MMKKIYVNGVHEYDYSKTQNQSPSTAEGQFHPDIVDVHSLYYSDHFEWSESVRDEVALRLIDTGDGINFGIPKSKIDYSEAQQLRILLGIILKDDCDELQIREDI